MIPLYVISLRNEYNQNLETIDELINDNELLERRHRVVARKTQSQWFFTADRIHSRMRENRLKVISLRSRNVFLDACINIMCEEND